MGKPRGARIRVGPFYFGYHTMTLILWLCALPVAIALTDTWREALVQQHVWHANHRAAHALFVAAALEYARERPGSRTAR